MASGGARARSGPAPDPNALRQNGEWTELPPRRQGPVPKWPLREHLVDMHKALFAEREAEVWADLWTMPQAIIWERDRMHHVVAMYVRRFCESEIGGSPINLATLVKQLAGELMLTPDGLARARLRISKVEPEAKPAPRRAGSARSRLTVVEGGG